MSLNLVDTLKGEPDFFPKTEFKRDTYKELMRLAKIFLKKYKKTGDENANKACGVIYKQTLDYLENTPDYFMKNIYTKLVKDKIQNLNVIEFWKEENIKQKKEYRKGSLIGFFNGIKESIEISGKLSE